MASELFLSYSGEFYGLVLKNIQLKFELYCHLSYCRMTGKFGGSLIEMNSRRRNTFEIEQN